MSTPFPQWLAGQRITAGALNARNMQIVTQSADQTLSNTTDLVGTDLQFTGDAGGTYYYNLLISYGASISADIKWAWALPSGAGITRFTQALQTGDNSAGQGSATAKTVVFRRPAATTGIPAGGSEDNTLAPTTFQSAYDQGILTFTGSGVAIVQFAPNTATSGAAATFRASSYLLYTRVA